MPTYDYQCPDCGHEFEEFQPMTAKPIKLCPKCGKRKVKRLIGSGMAPIFKGSGFYQTDYRAKPVDTSSEKREPRPQGSGPEGDTTKPAEVTPKSKEPADTKPAEASATKPDKKPASKPKK